MRDTHNSIKADVALSPQAITSDTTTVGATIDRDGFDSVEFAVASGVLTDGAFAVQVFAGTLSNMSDEVRATAAELLGAEPSFALTDDATAKRVGYIGGKQYSRIKVVSTAVTSGGLMGAVAVKGYPRIAPTA